MAYFQPNCTLPPDGVNYVASPNIRTTLDILWSSLATIVACTYSVLHLNVPKQRRGKDPGWKREMKWTLRRFGIKLKWCIVTIFMPEIILTRAVVDWLNARKQLKRLHRECHGTSQRVTITHMLFADMGGFHLAYRAGDLAVYAQHDFSNGQAASQDDMSLTGSSGSERNSGARILQVDLESGRESKSIHDSCPIEGTQTSERDIEFWHLDAHILVDLIVNKHLPLQLPHSEEIMDRSKSDILTKTITLMQICYFVLAVLVRAGHRQAICELELGTVAFVACSAVTYVVTIAKPKSPETPIVFSGLASVETMRHVQEYEKSSNATRFILEGARDLGSPPRNDLLTGGDAELFVLTASLLAAAVFSSIHIAGWNLSFPSVPDMWLWRASALATTGAPVIFLGFLFLNYLDAMASLLDSWWFLIPSLVPIPMYVVGRLILIVEMFRGLAYLPPDAFTTTWTANIPHIG